MTASALPYTVFIILSTTVEIGKNLGKPYIYTVSGKGSFVSGKSEIKRDPEKVKALLNNVGDSFRGLLMLGYSPEDAASLIQGTVMESLDSANKKL